MDTTEVAESLGALVDAGLVAVADPAVVADLVAVVDPAVVVGPAVVEDAADDPVWLRQR
jgi:hypothetical protein